MTEQEIYYLISENSENSDSQFEKYEYIYIDPELCINLFEVTPLDEIL